MVCVISLRSSEEDLDNLLFLAVVILGLLFDEECMTGLTENKPEFVTGNAAVPW
jgi:hypothetical protein